MLFLRWNRAVSICKFCNDRNVQSRKMNLLRFSFALRFSLGTQGSGLWPLQAAWAIHKFGKLCNRIMSNGFNSKPLESKRERSSHLMAIRNSEILIQDARVSAATRPLRFQTFDCTIQPDVLVLPKVTFLALSVWVFRWTAQTLFVVCADSRGGLFVEHFLLSTPFHKNGRTF